MINNFFQIVFYQPLFQALVFVYNILPGHDLGLTVLVLTVLIRVLTFPLNIWSFSAQRALSRIQPKLKEIQRKFKDNPQEQSKLIAEVFKKEKINPLASFIPLLIQLPILIAFYQLFLQGLWGKDGINPISLGVLDLSQPNFFLALSAAVMQFFQANKGAALKGLSSEKDSQNKFADIIQKQTLFLFPVLTFFILLRLPSALGLYWTVSSLLVIIEQYIFEKYHGFRTRTGDN